VTTFFIGGGSVWLECGGCGKREADAACLRGTDDLQELNGIPTEVAAALTIETLPSGWERGHAGYAGWRSDGVSCAACVLKQRLETEANAEAARKRRERKKNK